MGARTPPHRPTTQVAYPWWRIAAGTPSGGAWTIRLPAHCHLSPISGIFDTMNTRVFLNTAVKTILGLTLLAIAAGALLVGAGLITAHMPGAVPTEARGNGGPGFEYGGYLALTLVNLGLGTVVAWMLFGKRE
jgi:hypothetical protein